MPSDAVKIDIAYKRLSKRQYTSTLKKWHEEIPGKSFSIKFKDIWIDEISSTPPQLSTSTIQVVTDMILTEDVTVDNSLSWVACTIPGNISTRVGDFIQPDKDLSQAYYVKLYDNNGTQIYVGDPVGWEFDYANGVLTFENRPTTFTPPFKISAYRYVGTVGGPDVFPEELSTTLDKSYDGTLGSGSGRIINVDFGPVTLAATNGSAALQINPVDYTPGSNLADGQIVNRGGILYIYDTTRVKWLSMMRQNVIFGAKRADGVYLNLSDFSSNMSGWPTLRDGAILGITAQSSGGYASKQFKILKHGEPTPLFTFNLTNSFYSNGSLNINFSANDLIKILASSEFGVAYNTIITLEIGWRI